MANSQESFRPNAWRSTANRHAGRLFRAVNGMPGGPIADAGGPTRPEAPSSGRHCNLM